MPFSAVGQLAPLVNADKFSFANDVRLDRVEELGLVKPALEIQHLVEGVNMKMVMVGAVSLRRHRPAVSETAEIVLPLAGRGRLELRGGR